LDAEEEVARVGYYRCVGIPPSTGKHLVPHCQGFEYVCILFGQIADPGFDKVLYTIVTDSVGFRYECFFIMLGRT
jgi:hypothetical protein